MSGCWWVGLWTGWLCAGRCRGMWWLLWTLVRAISLKVGLEGPAAKTADRRVATQAWKSPWLVALFGRWEAQSAIEATMEPSATMGRNQRAKIPDERSASIGQRDRAARGTHR